MSLKMSICEIISEVSTYLLTTIGCVKQDSFQIKCSRKSSIIPRQYFIKLCVTKKSCVTKPDFTSKFSTRNAIEMTYQKMQNNYKPAYLINEKEGIAFN